MSRSSGSSRCNLMVAGRKGLASVDILIEPVCNHKSAETTCGDMLLSSAFKALSMIMYYIEVSGIIGGCI